MHFQNIYARVDKIISNIQQKPSWILIRLIVDQIAWNMPTNLKWIQYQMVI